MLRPVYFDIHLHAADPFAGTGDLEVHIAEMVFITEDVGENGVFTVSRAGDQSHGHAADVFGERHARIHQGQAAGANGRHGR